MDTDRIKKKFENMSNEELASFTESYDPSDFLPEPRKIIEEIIYERNKELGNYQKPKREIAEKENKLKGLGG